MTQERELEVLRAFVRLYKQVYMEDDTEPPLIAQYEVMAAARAIMDDKRNAERYRGPRFTPEQWRKIFMGDMG
jgi:hypothetical protein